MQCLLFLAGSCVAGPALFTSNYARFRSATNPLVSYACQSASPCSGSVTAPGTNWSVAYYSSASALNYGILHSTASIVLSGDSSLDGYASFASVGGSAAFQDSYTVTGAQGTGTLSFGFAVTGTSFSAAGTSGRGQFQMTPVVTGAPDFGSQTTATVCGGRATVSIPITFGIAKEVQIYFYGLAQILSWNTAGQSASADLLAVLDSVVVRDSSNAVVSGFSVSSTSGTSYTSSGVVPEPSTTILACVGAAGLAIARRLRRRTV